VGGVVAAGCLVWSFVPRLGRAVGVGLLGALVLNLVGPSSATWLSLLSTDASLFSHAPLFARLQARMTPQDRIYVADAPVPDAPPFDLMQKTPSLFRVPALFDYQPEVARRFAEFFVMLKNGRPMTSLNDVLFPISWFPPAFNRRLFDLSASRYLVASAGLD